MGRFDQQIHKEISFKVHILKVRREQNSSQVDSLGGLLFYLFFIDLIGLFWVYT